MSFPIVLYKNSSPVNKVTKDLSSAITTVTGVLRDGASVVDPVILLDIATPANIISSANYAYIAAFGRYYFITDIVSNPNELWTVSMHVDVLMTYQTQIRAQNAIVARQQSQYNMYLDDGWFMCYQNPDIKKKLFTAEHPFDYTEYVLVVAGS